MKPQNGVSHWNCQDYVIEAFNHLEEECIINEDDEVYIKVKREVKRYFGPL